MRSITSRCNGQRKACTGHRHGREKHTDALKTDILLEEGLYREQMEVFGLRRISLQKKANEESLPSSFVLHPSSFTYRNNDAKTKKARREWTDKGMIHTSTSSASILPSLTSSTHHLSHSSSFSSLSPDSSFVHLDSYWRLRSLQIVTIRSCWSTKRHSVFTLLGSPS